MQERVEIHFDIPSFKVTIYVANQHQNQEYVESTLSSLPYFISIFCVLLNVFRFRFHLHFVFLSKICKALTEFGARSTIHGVKQFAAPKRHWIERCVKILNFNSSRITILLLQLNKIEWNFSALWIVAVTASTIVCADSIMGVWSYWQKYPIIVETVNELSPINVIPLPAISICPYTVFAKNKFDFKAVYRLMGKFDGNNSRNLTVTEYVLNPVDFRFSGRKFSKFQSKFNSIAD